MKCGAELPQWKEAFLPSKFGRKIYGSRAELWDRFFPCSSRAGHGLAELAELGGAGRGRERSGRGLPANARLPLPRPELDRRLQAFDSSF